jgi:hypothetical protein
MHFQIDKDHKFTKIPGLCPLSLLCSALFSPLLPWFLLTNQLKPLDKLS